MKDGKAAENPASLVSLRKENNVGVRFMERKGRSSTKGGHKIVPTHVRRNPGVEERVLLNPNTRKPSTLSRLYERMITLGR